MSKAKDLAEQRRAVIDVGSNSVRLVIYDGPGRTPFVIHNEKIQAQLGRDLAETGRIAPQGYERALRGCRRFKALIDAIGVKAVRTVATAAVRDAENGPALLADLRAAGLKPELLSGDDEALASAAGVLSAFPGADGVVGDLGGGSLELIDLQAGTAARRATFPLGVLRLPALRAGGDKAFAQTVAKQLRANGWAKVGRGRPFYLVGGSWRALGHLDMHVAGSILPGVHGYAFARKRIKPLRAAIAGLGPRLAKTVPGVSSSRAATLDDAAVLLAQVGAALGADSCVVSTFGLREGLLYLALGEQVRRQDPLIAAVADYSRRRGNPLWQGDRVAEWIAPVFTGDAPAMARIRRAACHLAAVDLHPQSETRARHGMELAWLGGWIALDAVERALLAQALWTAWGGKGLCTLFDGLATGEQLERAAAWGQAIRLAERLTGGASAVLDRAQLVPGDGGLDLAIDPAWADLKGEMVSKQIAALAQAVGASAAIGER